MADTNDRDTLTPMTDTDVAASKSAKANAPLKNASGEAKSAIAGATQTLKESTTNLREQAGDKARMYAEDGKVKATNALGQLSQMLNDAAGTVDEKLGAQYGQYARTAADKVSSFSTSLESKDVDDLIGQAREMVRKSPAIAIGAAAAVGFVVARLLTSGVDQRDA